MYAISDGVGRLRDEGGKGEIVLNLVTFVDIKRGHINIFTVVTIHFDRAPVQR